MNRLIALLLLAPACETQESCEIIDDSPLAWDEESPDGATPDQVFADAQAVFADPLSVTSRRRPEVESLAITLEKGTDMPRFVDVEIGTRRVPWNANDIGFSVVDCAPTIQAPTRATLIFDEEQPLEMDVLASQLEPNENSSRLATRDALRVSGVIDEIPEAWEPIVDDIPTVEGVRTRVEYDGIAPAVYVEVLAPGDLDPLATASR